MSDSTTPVSVSGEAHKRFVMVTTLLNLIDPVRGEPTTHSLDKHPHDDAWGLERLQKKFLDSLALISSTSGKSGETASAVCLEQDHPSGTILRLARNSGVSTDLVDHLQEILNDLTAIALKDTMEKDLHYRILHKVIVLVEDRIRVFLQNLNKPEIHATIERAMNNLSNEETPLDDAGEVRFRQWIRNLPVLACLDHESNYAQLIVQVQWASEARWVYAEQLESFFESEIGEMPAWVKIIYKLGRYHTATKTMIKLAQKQPDVFAGIHIEPVQAPEQSEFSLGNDKTPLSTVLRKITKTDPEELKVNLGQIWLTEDPELRFRRACRIKLTVHAEMQLLSFYDHKPNLTPRLLFMGTSKKACYLCHEFMSRHPLAISMSATHQKLYPSWQPAPCSSAVRKRHKVLLWEFSRHLEQTTARDLETRLGIRRPYTMDSTAGPSLTSSGTGSHGMWSYELPLHVVGRENDAEEVLE